MEGHWPTTLCARVLLPSRLRNGVVRRRRRSQRYLSLLQSHGLRLHSWLTPFAFFFNCRDCFVNATKSQIRAKSIRKKKALKYPNKNNFERLFVQIGE